ncbi:hypothetical protein ACWDQ0_01125 [Streptomyces sp. NPDC003642]
MPISQAKKLTLFVVIGAAFGLFCIILGASEQDPVLMDAGALSLFQPAEWFGRRPGGGHEESSW